MKLVLKTYAANSAAAQQGAALVTGLILLLVMAMGGLMLSQTAVFDELSVRNQKDYSLASNAADKALRDAEGWLQAQSLLPEEQLLSCFNSSPACVAPVVIANDVAELASCTAINYLDANAWASYSTAALTRSSDASAGIVQQKSEYLIREADFIADSLSIGEGVQPGRYVYEITARGAANNDNSHVLLQSTYIRRY